MLDMRISEAQGFKFFQANEVYCIYNVLETQQ